jgi:hypothetical protein
MPKIEVRFQDLISWRGYFVERGASYTKLRALAHLQKLAFFWDRHQSFNQRIQGW